jgi:hypothetical protein
MRAPRAGAAARTGSWRRRAPQADSGVPAARAAPA